MNPNIAALGNPSYIAAVVGNKVRPVAHGNPFGPLEVDETEEEEFPAFVNIEEYNHRVSVHNNKCSKQTKKEKRRTANDWKMNSAKLQIKSMMSARLDDMLDEVDVIFDEFRNDAHTDDREES